MGDGAWIAPSRDILSQTTGDVVVVAHAGINCSYLAGLMGRPLETSRALSQPYGGFSRIMIDDRGVVFAADFGRKPRIYPEDRECRDIWDRYGTPEHVRSHCIAVAHQAVRLGIALSDAGCRIDLGLIRSAALLHDVVRDQERIMPRRRKGFDERGIPALSRDYPLPSRPGARNFK